MNHLLAATFVNNKSNKSSHQKQHNECNRNENHSDDSLPCLRKDSIHSGDSNMTMSSVSSSSSSSSDSSTLSYTTTGFNLKNPTELNQPAKSSPLMNKNESFLFKYDLINSHNKNLIYKDSSGSDLDCVGMNKNNKDNHVKNQINQSKEVVNKTLVEDIDEKEEEWSHL